MLAVALIWIYVIFTAYLTGYALLTFISSLDCMQISKGKSAPKRYTPYFRESYIVAGIVVNTVYAQFFSLIGKVGLVANLLLVAVCAVIAVYYRDDLRESFFNTSREVSANKVWIYYLVIFLLMAYGTSHGIMHYDSDLYHAQAIRWIEEYGVVRGLGNLHVRFAYNSSSFALSALYSMSFLKIQSFHVMGGFFALLLAWQCLDLKNIVRRGHPILSDFARIMALYYLFTIFDEMVAPASDYFLSCIVFYIIIHWLDMNVKHVHLYMPYIMLALLGVFAVTIKLSAAPMVILSIIPIYKLFSNKSQQTVKAFWVSVLLALIIVVPFLVRNIIISGWILYPVTSLDFFGFSWEIPKGVAAFDAKEIKTFGRGYNDVVTYGDVPFKQWIVNWFNGISGFNKIMIILDIISIVIYIACVIYFFVVAINEKSKKKTKLSQSKVFNISHRSMVNFADFLTLSGTMILCLAFWLFSAPLIRYGEVYVCLTFAIILGRLLILGYNRIDVNKTAVKWIFRACICLFFVWLLYKGANLVADDVPRFNARYLVAQQDYGDYEVATFELGGEVFYYPTEGDRIGYKYFPAATSDMTGKVKLRGNSIQSGFESISE